MSDHANDAINYGQRLLVHLLDEFALNEPTRPYIHQPISNDPKDGYRAITYKEVADAVNYVANKLLERRKASNIAEDEFPTVAYIGPGDVRYVVIVLACVKAHGKALLISPRNSSEAQISLFKRTDCVHLLYDKSYHSIIQPWLEKYPMGSTQIRDFDVWLESSSPHVPYNKSFEEARWDPMLVMHTSGSTGIPKPILARQGCYAVFDRLQIEPDYRGSPSIWKIMGTPGTKAYIPMPLFHAAGMTTILNLGLNYGIPIYLNPINRPLSADLVKDSLNASGAHVTFLPASILEDLSTTEEGVKCLAALFLAGYGGGSLAPVVGDNLTKRGVRLFNIISSTEVMPYLIQYQSNPKLWQWHIFNSRDMGADFRQVSDDGIYELYIRRIDPKDPGLQSVFYTFPEKTEWSTGDLYKPHPTLPDHWHYQGRADNIIVFSNGEKLNPVTIEEAVVGHSRIKGALVVGQQKFQPALILEPHEYPADAAATKALIDDVWPIIEEVNEITVAHGRLVRDLVVVGDADKPFVRAPKGTVQRPTSVKLYSDFIEKIYKQADEGINLHDAVELDIKSPDRLAKSILDVIASELGKPGLEPETDLFSVGVDSMQVITLSRRLRSSLEAEGVKVDANTVAPRVIYANTTPKGLAEHLYSTAISGGSAGDANAREIKALADIISKYTTDLPAPNPKQSDPLDDGQTVIVTGTTGSLGAYMLDRLVSNPRVAKVLAFNRGDDGGSSRQLAYNAARGLTTDFSKVEFLGVDLSKALFGLSQQKYDEILGSTDRIIHNAWPVNFNISVASFEPYICGVRRLVDFSNQAAKRAAILFISSVGIADGWTSKELVPERKIDDLSLPHMGYGRSKLAGSLILDAAAEKSGVPSATVRVGQIGGPKTKKGMWNRQEFLPSLIASSVYLGILPDSIGPVSVVDWVPVEDIAGLVLDVAGITKPVPLSNISGYFHGINPATTSWTEVSRLLKTYYNGRIKEIVPLEKWVAALEKSANGVTTVDAEKNPGIKLIDTYQAMITATNAGLGHVYFDVSRTVENSQTMKALKPVDAGLIQNWCDQWKY